MALLSQPTACLRMPIMATGLRFAIQIDSEGVMSVRPVG
jgi:hypothetical protein